MSALYTALVESETKESLATMVCDLREQRAALLTALDGASGYLLNAKIDLETGATKRTAINTIEGGIKMVRAAITAARETFTTGQARNGVAP